MQDTGQRGTPESAALYEALSSAPLEAYYTNEAGIPRDPTATELQIDRVLTEFPDRVRIETANDGESFIRKAHIVGPGYTGSAWLTRLQTADGRVMHTYLSGLYFMNSVTNDAYKVDASGKLNFIPIVGAEPITRNNLRDRLKIYSKLRRLSN